MKPLVIYHGNCMDGFSAAWCFWRKFAGEVEYHAGSFGIAPPEVANREVYLVDFSYPRARVAQMLSRAKRVVLIDHHESALQDLADLPGLEQYTDLQRSGAILAWDYWFAPEPPPLLLQYVQDRDLWRFQLPDTREILAAMFSFDYSFTLWDELMAYDAQQLQSLKREGTAIDRKQRKDIQQLLGIGQRRMTIGGVNVPVANMPGMMASEAAHLMAQGEAFAACYWDGAKSRKFELRSSESGMNVAQIAKQYGGGGHAKAAGFSVPRSHVLAKS